MTETLSITRALVELKTLDKRLDKKITELSPVAILTGDRLPKDIKSKEEFERESKANYQSIRDLMTRRAKIKSAVVQSNAVISIDVGGARLTVAEAIERKNSIEIDKKLRRSIASAYTSNLAMVESTNESLKSQLHKLLEATYSKSESQIGKDDFDKVAIPFRKNNEATLIDPLGAKALQEKIDEEIIAFEAEVDVAISESNARTEITIS